MTLANAKVLHAHLKKIGRTADLLSIERRYPKLAEKLEEKPVEEEKKVLDPPVKEKPKPKKTSPPPEKKSLSSKAKDAFKK